MTEIQRHEVISGHIALPEFFYQFHHVSKYIDPHRNRVSKCTVSNDDNLRDFTLHLWHGGPCPDSIFVVNMAPSICYWYNYTRKKLKLTSKSDDAVNSDQVLKFSSTAKGDISAADVQASIRAKSYDVQVRRLLSVLRLVISASKMT
jgi:hypothetical protein